MKTLIAATFAAIMIFALEMAVPKSSEAQVVCKYDWVGNYVCRDSGLNTSTTKRDWLGNDVTNFSDGTRMSCKTDWLGNYVCN